jgi:hypothetical protein
VNITPLANPRLFGAINGNTVVAARTISAPPASPETKRQLKNQRYEAGAEQARRETLASSIMERSVDLAPKRPAKKLELAAPARYPAKLAAPRYAASSGLNQP